MQNTKGEWQKVITRLHNRKNFANYDLATQAIRKLGYPDFYKNATIVDAYSGAGVFSAALHNELNPSTHIILEPLKGYYKFLKILERPNVFVEDLDPFRWGSFGTLREQGKLAPEEQPYSQVHNKLLFVANLSHPQGEQLTAQYLNCISNRSWLEKYGRVRLLLWMRAKVAEKLVANAGELGRHRMAVQRDSCCDVRVVFHEPFSSKANSGAQGYPALLKTPLCEYDYKRDVKAQSHSPLSLIELTPKEQEVENLDEFEYVNKMLFISRSTPLRASLNTLGPGGSDDLAEPLKDLLDKVPTDLTIPELERIVKAFVNWPFRPDFLHNFYEEALMGRGSNEDKHF
ncbi:Mitochondrial transcription factor 1 [Wickerhamiella sorbophila]|uniref:rRNA adenine N(6)-methyltransferase n=1 Tax=Wickerhamiella sorbophila TaxID=45607 RepID=A0A2T0FN56_9ASCO|nr:Mitochondrial transcription factor 1 [Wickerhamiella sorbophila]PRT56422.1 Mitochondrial transcription factor 1 [Wickerhamiella sorbophila]